MINNRLIKADFHFRFIPIWCATLCKCGLYDLVFKFWNRSFQDSQIGCGQILHLLEIILIQIFVTFSVLVSLRLRQKLFEIIFSLNLNCTENSLPNLRMHNSTFFIMLTCPCNEDPFTPHFYKAKLGFTGVYTGLKVVLLFPTFSYYSYFFVLFLLFSYFFIKSSYYSYFFAVKCQNDDWSQEKPR